MKRILASLAALIIPILSITGTANAAPLYPDRTDYLQGKTPTFVQINGSFTTGGGSPVGPLANLVDHNDATTGGTGYTYQTAAVGGFRFDMGAVKSVKTIRVQGANYRPAVIQSSLDNTTWTTLWGDPNYSTTSNTPSAETILDLPTATNMRYLRVGSKVTCQYSGTGCTAGGYQYSSVEAYSEGPPSIPTGLTATPGPGSVSLSWTASNGANGYRVTRDGAQVADVTGTTWSDTTGTPGTNYTYAVKAYNGLGESSPSATVTASPGNNAPTAPAGLTATFGTTPGTVGLSWTAGTGTIDGYRIYRDGAAIGTTATVNYTDLPPNGATVGYTVTAYGPGGESTASNTASVNIPQVPGAPGQFAATATGDGHVSLTWSAPATGGAPSGYHVYRDGARVAEVAGLTYTDTGTTWSTGYEYVLLAWNAGGYSAPSSPATVNIGAAPAPPGPVRNLGGNAGPERLTLTWSPPTGTAASGYRVYVDGTLTETLPSTVLTYTATGLTGGQAYTLGVVAYNSAGDATTETVTLTPAVFAATGNLWRLDFLGGLGAAVTDTMGSMAPLFLIVAGLVVASTLLPWGIDMLLAWRSRRGL